MILARYDWPSKKIIFHDEVALDNEFASRTCAHHRNQYFLFHCPTAQLHPISQNFSNPITSITYKFNFFNSHLRNPRSDYNVGLCFWFNHCQRHASLLNQLEAFSFEWMATKLKIYQQIVSRNYVFSDETGLTGRNWSMIRKWVANGKKLIKPLYSKRTCLKKKNFKFSIAFQPSFMGDREMWFSVFYSYIPLLSDVQWLFFYTNNRMRYACYRK